MMDMWFWLCWRLRWSTRRKEKEDERVIWEVLRSRCNSRRKEKDEQEILGLL